MLGAPENIGPIYEPEDAVGGRRSAGLLQEISPTTLDTATRYWLTTMSGVYLTLRLKELLLLAMHVTPSALNADAVRRQVRRAVSAGATPAEVVDVIMTTVGVANHALYSSIPILEDELRLIGVEPERVDVLGDDFEETKREFTAVRGFWNADRESLARLMPEYFNAICALSVEPWKNGPLTTKEREFVCIAINSTVTHSFEPGLRVHIRNALANGGTVGEILEICQLAGLFGLESLSIGMQSLVATTEAGSPAVS